jgi:hypothetical protein
MDEVDYEEERRLERIRLLNYFKHRYYTFISIFKDSLRARRVMKYNGLNANEIPLLGKRNN